MPRWASRLTLEVVSVHVERLQDIGEADAIAEGVSQHPAGRWSAGDAQSGDTAKAAYRLLWNSINGRGSWDENPWVWVITFRTLRPAPALSN